MLYRELERCLRTHGVTRQGTARALVACSGGPDSVALAHVACKLLGPQRVVLGHVDHGVRPDSGADAVQVADLAARFGAQVRIERLALDRDDEATLRVARYAALERLRQGCDAELVLTAHTADDQAETVVLGLLRAPHPAVLMGMPEVRGRVLRPWLSVTRAAVLRHVGRHRLPVRLDPSNVEPRYLRNRVRKELLPLIESRYRPGFAQRLAALAQELARTGLEGDSAALDDPRPPRGAGPAPRSPRPPDFVPPAVWMDKRAWRPDHALPPGPHHVVFDAQTVDSVQIRALRPGDHIEPFGGPGHRKVRDVLREAGILPGWRPFYPVVTDSRERVLWVPGLLRSSHAKVGETTETVWWCGVDRKDELRAETSRATVDGA